MKLPKAHAAYVRSLGKREVSSRTEQEMRDEIVAAIERKIEDGEMSLDIHFSSSELDAYGARIYLWLTGNGYNPTWASDKSNDLAIRWD